MSAEDDYREMYTQLSRQCRWIAELTLVETPTGKFTISRESLIFLLTDSEGDSEVLEQLLHALAGIGDREQ